MTTLFLVNLDMCGNEIQNVVLHPLASAPSGATIGRVYYDTTDHLLKTYNGTSWDPAGAVLSVNGQTGAVTIGKSDVGLGNVDNKSEATIKSDFTGSIADGNTGFVTGDAIYDALANKQVKITASGILKGDGSGGVTAATAGTDYGTYSKPSGGIPETDLASALQTKIDGALQKTGGTMSGDIAMGSKKITDLANGTAATDAAAFGQIPVAGTSNPVMNGTASAGSATTWSKSDHIHPSDTSRQVKITASGLLKGDGNGGVTAATAGTDYVTPENYNPDPATAAMTQSVGVDANGKLWTAPGGASTHIETILDYTFAEDCTCSEAPNFCDYILSDGQKCVWNKDNNGNLLKAKRVWAAITLTQEIPGAVSDYKRSGFRLHACCKDLNGGSTHIYEDVPSHWWYGDDIGNGAGTSVLTAENIFNQSSIPNGISTSGWFDRETFTGLYGMTANNIAWANVGGATLGMPPRIIFNMNRESENVTYKDYIYAVTLEDTQPTKPVPAGLRIKIVAEVYDA